MTRDKSLDDVFVAHHDDSNLAAESAQLRAAAQALGFDAYCRKIAESGLNKQQAWKFVRMNFADKSFKEFSAEFDRPR